MADYVQITLPANQSDSNIASTRISHPIHPDAHVLRNAVANVQLSEALGRMCLPVAHGPTVPVQQSMTDILHHRPSSPNLSQLAVLSCLKVHYRIASNVYTHSTCYLVVFTACVMPSVDSIRRESHAATQDVFQPLLTQYASNNHS